MSDVVYLKEKIERGYLVVLSSGPAIQCDPDELPKITAGIEKGHPVMLRRGMFNPSFFVSVVDDDKRRVEFIENNKYNDEITTAIRARGMIPLKDIFADSPLQLTSGNE